MQVVRFGLSDEPMRARYDALFDATPRAFIQQSSAWADVIEDVGPDEPIFLIAFEGDEAVGGLPLYLFRNPVGNILSSVPQAGPLGGIFCRPGFSLEPIYAALLAAADHLAVHYACLTLTFISNPIRNDEHLYEECLAPTLLLENFSQVLEVDKAVYAGEFVLPNSTDPNIRRHIRKSASLGYRVRVSEGAADFDAWYRLHVERHTEIEATPLDRKLLSNIVCRLVPRSKGLFVVIEKDGMIVGGCLFIFHREVADVFILSTSSTAAKEGANYLLVKESILMLAAKGVKLLNWQSSPRRGDGVYGFKKRWGSEERIYYFVTKVYCAPDKILSLGAEGVRREYPSHYVVPFGVFESGFGQRRFRKL